MDLAEFLSRYPGIRLAAENDNAAILDFFDQSPIHGGSFRIRSVRSPDFFRFLRYQGEKHFVFLFENEKKELRGVFTLSIRDGYLNGAKERVGYVGDLRIRFDRRTIQAWRSFVSELLHAAPRITEFQGCSAFLAAIIDHNEAAQNSLIRPRREGAWRFRRLSGYRMVNILKKMPWAGLVGRPSFVKSIEIRNASAADAPLLAAFLDRENQRRPFGFCYSSGELARRLGSWPGLRLESFVLAVDPTGKILGAFAPWSPLGAKVNVAEAVPPGVRLLKPLLAVPASGEVLRTIYLTHLELSSVLEAGLRMLVFKKMVDEFFRQPGRDRSAHMISFCDYEAWGLHHALKRSYLLQTVPMSLNFVESEGSDNPVTQAPGLGGRTGSPPPPPGFEMALV